MCALKECSDDSECEKNPNGRRCDKLRFECMCEAELDCGHSEANGL